MAENSQANVPWYAVLVSSVLTGLLVFVATSVNVTTSGAASTTPSIGALFTETALFIPHALILFGIVADMFAYQGAYALASLFGLGSIFLNKGLDLFWAGIAGIIDRVGKVTGAGTGTLPAVPVGQSGGSVVNYPGCTVQGFDYFAAKYSSQTLVVTSTILSYYIFDLAMNKGIAAAGASIGLGILLFGLQAASMKGGGCFRELDFFKGVATSLANGFFIGGFFYGIMEAYGTQYLPSKVIPSIPKVSVTDLKVDAGTGKLVDSSGKSWNILPDGTPIPDMCGELSISDVDSTGRPASGGTCPGGAVTAR